MSPTEILKNEHTYVLMVLDGAEQISKTIDTTGQIDADKIEKLIDFSRHFTDGCHHTKEEKLLFPKMGEKGFSTDFGPVAVMLAEHVEGRGYIGEIEKRLNLVMNGDESAKPMLARSIRDYIYLLRSHISKENDILFNMADQALNVEEQAKLSLEFEKADAEELGEAAHAKYIQIAKEFSEI